MKRREFLATAAATAIGANLLGQTGGAAEKDGGDGLCCGPTHASPAAAMKSPRETLLYVPCIYAGTPVHKPDYLATVNVDPASKSYGDVIHRLPMPNVGDELHHFGWNACSSCHGDRTRRFMIVPGLASSRIHVIDAANPREPKLHKVIEPADIAEKVNLSAPHTVHCLADGKIMISMLGDGKGAAPGGFLLLDQEFNIAGRWEKDLKGMEFNYDYWYQPRHNVMVSSEWAAPTTFSGGFKLEDVKGGKYGHHIHFWDWKERTIAQSVDLGETGMIPLEVRFHHNPDSKHGFVGAALSSSIWHWDQKESRWDAQKIIQVESVEHKDWPFPVPGLITDIVLSLDDRWLYYSNWLHGDIRQYDVSDPAKPRLAAQAWLGGVLGKPASVKGKRPVGGPQMLQLSLDGKRLYVTSSLYSSWDNQFYPDMAKQGSFLRMLDCDTDHGGLTVNEDFAVDFGREPDGPARAHEMRFPGGDCTSDIWV